MFEAFNLLFIDPILRVSGENIQKKKKRWKKNGQINYSPKNMAKKNSPNSLIQIQMKNN